MLIKFWSDKFCGKFRKSTIYSTWIRNGVQMKGPRYDIQVGDLGVGHNDCNNIETLIPVTKKEIINE